MSRGLREEQALGRSEGCGEEGRPRQEDLGVQRPEAEHSRVPGDLSRLKEGEVSPWAHLALWVLQRMSNFFVGFLGDRFSQYSPGLPGIHYVAQAGSELLILLPQQPPGFRHYLCGSTPH